MEYLEEIGRRAHRTLTSLARFRQHARPFVSTTVIVGLAAAISPVLQRLPLANLSLLFMTGVLVVALRYGLWPSVYGSFLSFLVYNFLFTPPVYTFSVNDEGDLASLVFFLIMASLTGNLAARMRDAIRTRDKAMRHSAELQELTRHLAGAVTGKEVLQHLVNHLENDLTCCAVASASRDASARVCVISKNSSALHDNPTKVFQRTSDSFNWTSWTIETTRGLAGRVAVNKSSLTPEQREHAGALTSQTIVALERTVLVEELAAAKLVSERERMRAGLLSSVSHDLRTPLSSVIGSASSLLEYDASLSVDSRTILLRSVLDEAERLDRYIQNLLDMTRLDQGMLNLQCNWEDIGDLVASASRRLRLAACGFRVRTQINEGAELVFLHGELIEQVLVNLLDNAVHFSSCPGEICVNATMDRGDVVIEVCDNGPGIAVPERENVFDPFYRVNDRDKKPGTGLGLSVCRGIVRAHGGEITAHAGPGGAGALLRIRIPQTQKMPMVSADA
jgi:two-component system sensor histidine kinase KdpD